jgi:ABC-type glycerol-3-phosphate transport system substrate-binding protein
MAEQRFAMTRRGLLATTAGASSVLALAACGQMQAPAAAPEAAEAPKSEDMPKMEEATVNVNWVVNIHENAGAFEDLVLGPFQELHPNITVNWQSLAYRVLMEKQVVELAAGSSPDILGPEPTRYPQYRDAGYITDLSPFVQRDAAALADVVGIDWLQDPEGKLWTFPYGVLATIQIYNTALLDKFGINEPPKSWNPSDGGELLEIAREITQRSSADQNPIWGFYSRNDSTTEVPTMLIQNGTNFVSEDYSRFRLHEPEFIDVIQFLYDLEFRYRVKPTREDVAALNDTIPAEQRRDSPFVHQRAAVFHTWFNTESGWNVPGVEELPVKARRFPAHTVKSTHSDAVGSYTPVQYMWSGAKYPDATWELIKFVSTDIEVQVGVTTLLNYGMPVIRSAWDDPRLAEQKARPPRELTPITEPIGEGNGFMTQIYPNYVDIRRVYLDHMNMAWKQEMTVAEAMQSAGKIMQAMIDEYYANKS